MREGGRRRGEGGAQKCGDGKKKEEEGAGGVAEHSVAENVVGALATKGCEGGCRTGQEVGRDRR